MWTRCSAGITWNILFSPSSQGQCAAICVCICSHSPLCPTGRLTFPTYVGRAKYRKLCLTRQLCFHCWNIQLLFLSEREYDTRTAEAPLILLASQGKSDRRDPVQAAEFVLFGCLKSSLLHLLVPLFFTSEVMPECETCLAICEPCTLLQAKRPVWSNHCT